MINPHAKEAFEFMKQLSILYDMMHRSQIYAYTGLVKTSIKGYDCPLSHKSRANFYKNEEDKAISEQINRVLEAASKLGDAAISPQDKEILDALSY